MSLIALNNCDYDIGDYDCGENSYGYKEDGVYEGYECSHDQEMDKNEGYYSKGKCEMNYDPSSYNEYGHDEEPYKGSYKEMRHVRSIVLLTPIIEVTFVDHERLSLPTLADLEQVGHIFKANGVHAIFWGLSSLVLHSLFLLNVP
ncbi:hypothetical protein FXO38_18774 [Capsicum annuum]|nr:hypothetical protein FXO38_18774 [Capsicum annuum]